MIKTVLLGTVLAALLPVQINAQQPNLPTPAVSEELNYKRKQISVLDSHMSYIEDGTGSPVLFLHGNPTSAYLWRNVLPHVSKTNRTVAVDLIGMGESGKPGIAYSFSDHVRYLDAFIERMKFKKLTLVGHDWGATLAWHYARRHPSNVSAIAFMEGVLPPAFPLPSYEAIGEAAEGLRALRDPERGGKLVYEQNMFVEQMLPGFVNRPLGEKAMQAYRAPYKEPKSRLPTLQWPRELPIAGIPAENVLVMQGIAEFMTTAGIPKLLLYVTPGVATPEQSVEWYKANLRGLETAYVGQGLHFIQEDQPQAIGHAIADWLRRHP